MQFIDTHIHLQDYKSNNAPQFLSEINRQGVEEVVCAATKEGDWQAVCELAEEFPGRVVPALGLHPWYLQDCSKDWHKNLQELLEQNPQALVGECGLDRLKDVPSELQKEIFAEHIRLAKEYNRPLLVHAVKVQDWLEAFWPILKEVKFVLHSFSGSVELLRRALSFGAYISFCPKTRIRKNFKELAQAVPLQKLLFESDGPYQGNPTDIPALAKDVAECKNMELKELAAEVYKNSREFIDVR